jgi:class 3 adenylate cyclase/tetratricopeptide (TPR) repeat protein
MNESTRPASPLAPRRRYLTILFSDLSDSTGIASRLEAEDYSDLLARLRAVYHRVVADHGGTITQISGDGMLAIFGYPEAREDDGRRATEAALALHEAVAALDCGESLQLHSGIHSGLVLLHEGDQVRGRFELLGSATNIASRLCGIAQPGQILVSEATLGPERHLFEAEERNHLNLRGKEEPVVTLAILGRAAAARSRYAASVRGGLTPFVGREGERDRLLEALDQVLAGRPRFIEIEGPAGVGKTRLAEEVLRTAAARGCPVHRGECEAAAEPLQPFLQIARSLAGPGDPGGDDIAALPAVLEGLSAQGPLALFIDDWHLADDASREMLAAIRDLNRPIFALLTARPGADDAPIAEILPLAPFTAEEIAEAVGRLLPSPDPFLIAEIGESSGGNALFIEELCHSIADGRRGEAPRGGNPWLDILIESRLSRLPGPQEALVRKAAVIGTVIPAWLLEAIAGHGERDPLITGLAEQDFIFPCERAGTLRFKHGLARDAIYESVGLHERRALHLEIAAALRARGRELGEEEPHEALAYHYGAGEDWAATAHHAELAGDRAMAVSALDRAQARYKAALTALDRLPPSPEIAAHWGLIVQRFGLAGVFDPSRDQLAVFERAVERATASGDRGALALAEYWLGYINYGLGEAGAAIAHCTRALQAAAGLSDDRLVVQIRATLGQARAAACDYRGALLLLDEAIEVKRRHRTGAHPSVGFAYSLACKAFALGDMGRFAEAHAGFAEAMAAVRGAQHEVESSVLCQWSAVCLWQGKVEDALRYAEEAEQVAERVRTRYLHAMGRSLGAYARWCRDRDLEAVATIRQATRWLEESGRGQFISLNYGWLSDLLARAGEAAEARIQAARAFRRARRGDRLGEAMAWRALARLAAAGAYRRTVEECLGRAYAVAASRGAPHEVAVTRLVKAELALAAGDRPKAALRLAETLPSLAAMDMRWHLAEAERLAEALDPS